MLRDRRHRVRASAHGPPASAGTRWTRRREAGYPPETTMKIDGALLPFDITRTGADARALEARGFDGLLVFEGTHDPFVTLAVAAGHTTRVELSTAVAIAFARNPMTCAYLANDLQLLSHGRFVLGLGTQVR